VAEQNSEITRAFMLDDGEWRLRIDNYWAEFLGCRIEDLFTPDSKIVFSENSPGVFGLMLGHARVYSMGHQLRGVFSKKDRDSNLPTEKSFTPDRLVSLLDKNGVGIDEAYGPGYLTYCHRELFCPADERDVLLLSDADKGQIELLGERVGWTNIFHTTSSSWIARFGIFRDAKLVSLTTVRPWANRVASMMVATDPDYRGCGFATSAVSKATRWVLEKTNMVPQYDTSINNLSSLRIAHVLGYQYYGQIIYIRVV
jgi:RimJ/RimL family protein N-acetyltransferase